MSKAAERRAEQDAFDRDQERAMNERPSEAASYLPKSVGPRSWASNCAGWRVGIHERTKDDRLAGIYKCKWCAQTFDPPSADELQAMRDRSIQYQRPQQMRRGKW